MSPVPSEPKVKATVPVPLPIVVLPVPVVFKFNGVPTKDKVAAVEDIVPAPAKVIAVAECVIVSIEDTPVKAPPVVTFKPVDVKAKLPVALPIEIAVALVVPKFKPAAESMVKAPALVDQVEAAPEVRVKAAPVAVDMLKVPAPPPNVSFIVKLLLFKLIDYHP